MDYKLLVALLFTGILFTGLASAHATNISIYYPIVNTTSDIYYATDDNPAFTHIQADSIAIGETTNFTCVVIKECIVTTDNVLDSPETLYQSVLPIFWITLLIFIFLMFIWVVKKVFL